MTCYNVDELGGHNAKQNKPVTKRQTPYNMIYMRYLKQIHRNREQSGGYKGLVTGEGKKELFNEYRIPVLQEVLIRVLQRQRDLLGRISLHNYRIWKVP